MKCKIIKLLVWATVVLGGAVVHACMLHITNDTAKTVTLVSQNNNQRAVIAPGQMQKFGDPSQRALFTVECEGSSLCSVKQIGCSESHKIMCKISDMQKGKLDPNLFDVSLSGTSNSAQRVATSKKKCCGCCKH